MDDDCQLPSIYMELYNVNHGFFSDDFDQLGSSTAKGEQPKIYRINW